MSVRILHTADLHIGLRFRHISNAIVRERLVKERIDALRNMVARANEQNCDFFVIAGDLFDRQDIPKGQIGEVVETLTRFNGEVLIIPGNHDFYEGTHSKLWDQFTRSSINTHIQLLVTKEPVELVSKDGQTVCFYPCPCPSKHSAQNEIGWVHEIQKDPAHLHMGIAHGNVEGLALDSEGRYFNMHAQELREAGLDSWLLGHVHVPYPQANYTGNPGYFMAGTHTPERINRSTTGQCWFIEFSPEKQTRFEQWGPGTISFVTNSKKLSGQEDVELLETELLQFDAPNTLLTLALTGNLSQAERDILNEMLDSIKGRFLHVSVEDDIRQKIDAAQIQTEFSDNTFSQQLLMQLLNAQDPELKVQLAYDIIKGLEK